MGLNYWTGSLGLGPDKSGIGKGVDGAEENCPKAESGGEGNLGTAAKMAGKILVLGVSSVDLAKAAVGTEEQCETVDGAEENLEES